MIYAKYGKIYVEIEFPYGLSDNKEMFLIFCQTGQMYMSFSVGMFSLSQCFSGTILIFVEL